MGSVWVLGAGRSWLNCLVLTSGVLGILAVVGVAPTAALTATPLGTNLIKNGGFEAGTAGTGNDVVPIPNWVKDCTTSECVPTVVAYGSPGGFPTHRESRRINGGDNFYACGPNTSYSLLTQKLRLLGRNSLIDQELIALTVKARIATYDSQADAGRIRVTGRATATSDGLPLWSWSTADVTATNGKFQLVTLTDVVPAGTRYVEIALFGYRVSSGTYCDAYFDKITAVITKLT